MTSHEIETLGTWTLAGQRITAAYYDVDAVRLSNSLGQSDVVSVREWLDRYDGLRDDGWTRVARNVQ